MCYIQTNVDISLPLGGVRGEGGGGRFVLYHIVKIMFTGNCFELFLIDKSFSL